MLWAVIYLVGLGLFYPVLTWVASRVLKRTGNKLLHSTNKGRALIVSLCWPVLAATMALFIVVVMWIGVIESFIKLVDSEVKTQTGKAAADKQE